MPVKSDNERLFVSKHAKTLFNETFDRQEEVGKAKYGTLLQINNGRSASVDAMQELADLTKYLTQLKLENEFLIFMCRNTNTDMQEEAKIVFADLILNKRTLSDEREKELLELWRSPSPTIHISESGTEYNISGMYDHFLVHEILRLSKMSGRFEHLILNNLEEFQLILHIKKHLLNYDNILPLIEEVERRVENAKRRAIR